MKKVLFNEDKLTKNDINHEIKRAKLLIINDNEEFLLCHSYDTYHIIGGHVNNGESDRECILREVKEESGIVLTDEEFTPLMEIRYYCKDYPEKGINTEYIAHYYFLHKDEKPHMKDAELTHQEVVGEFKIKRIPRDKAMDILQKEYDISTKKNVIRDTMLVIEEYLKTH
jgi:8-oxo-dGTP pyrophosphatase MutT (NUDIX family)